MPKRVKDKTATTNSGYGNRTARRTYAITQRGIKSDRDLSDFLSAMVSDIDGGRADLKEAAAMRGATGQLISLANLRYKVGLFGAKANSKKLLLT